MSSLCNLTCLSCNVVFGHADLQRAHYKSEWHRYNLKRKVAELPPVTSDEFLIIVQAQKQKKDESIKEKSTATLCKVCNKVFSNENSFKNHIESKKHKDMLKKSSIKLDECQKDIIIKPNFKPSKKNNSHSQAVLLESETEDKDEWEDVSTDEEEFLDEDENYKSEAILQNFCLFCPHESVMIEDNLRHMSKSHSFYIPDLDYITDLEAMLIYLGAKVGDGKMCLLCNTHSKQFQTLRACQNHMIDKGHCMLNYESDAMLEYADFYDYSDSYPDDHEDIDSDLSASDFTVSIDPDTLELMLPSGARIGHRALKKYYDQNIPDRTEQPLRSNAMITGLGNHYRALGLTGTHLTVAVQKKLQAKKIENKQRAGARMILGVKANKLQKHFRKQYAYAG